MTSFDVWFARRPPSAERLVAAVAACLSALTLAATPALAVRGHVFSTTFGSEGSGPGQLSEPMGMAVNEASGDVYVAEFGNNRVQWFSYNAGQDKYEVAGQIAAATGSGTGTLTEGSATIESVASTSGAFVVGQTIAGEGIPAGTTITGVSRLAGTIEISSAVGKKTPGGKEKHEMVALSATQPLPKVTAIAVDNSSGESAGDVYVSSGELPAVIDKFTATGEFVGQISDAAPGEPAFEVVTGLAVDPKGALWVAENHGFGNTGEEDH